jgi:hypothetical protein
LSRARRPSGIPKEQHETSLHKSVESMPKMDERATRIRRTRIWRRKNASYWTRLAQFARKPTHKATSKQTSSPSPQAHAQGKTRPIADGLTHAARQARDAYHVLSQEMMLLRRQEPICLPVHTKSLDSLVADSIPATNSTNAGELETEWMERTDVQYGVATPRYARDHAGRLRGRSQPTHLSLKAPSILSSGFLKI